MFNGTLKVGFFIYISWRCLKIPNSPSGVFNSDFNLFLNFLTPRQRQFRQ